MLLIKCTDNVELLNTVDEFRSSFLDTEFIKVNTSGSTGAPKTIQLKKEFAIASAQKTLDFFHLNKDSNALLCLSPDTIAGKMMIVRAIQGNLNLVIGEVSSHPLKNCDERIDFAAMVPLQLENSIDHDLEKTHRIKTIIVGGGPVSPALGKKIKDHQLNVYHTFGMTETISHIALRKIEEGNRTYEALKNVSFTSEDNQLIIHAPDIGIDNLKTNDLVELIDDHHFIWLGRADFVINSGGIKLHPEQIENKLSDLIHEPFFSTGLPDVKLGEKHVICINTSDNKLTKKILKNYLSGVEVPKELYLFDSFAYTKSGKINRVETLKNIGNAIKKVL